MLSSGGSRGEALLARRYCSYTGRYLVYGSPALMVASTAADIQGLEAAGRLVRRVFAHMKAAAHPGISTAELDQIAIAEFLSAGAESAPVLYYDFPGATCISVNEEAAHGIPGPRRLKAGDIINIDVSANLNGYVADMGESFVVADSTAGRSTNVAQRQICEAVQYAVQQAIKAVYAGCSLNVVGAAVQKVADSKGYQIVSNLGSHGVGRSIHEEPSYVPFDNPREKRRLELGQVFTIEPFFTTGKPWVEEQDDGWTLCVKPGELVAQFEQTVIVGARDAQVVTA